MAVITFRPLAQRPNLKDVKDPATKRSLSRLYRRLSESYRLIYNDLQDLAGGGGAGAITAVGNVGSGPAFDGTQGNLLTFYNAGGNGALGYDGTKFDIDKPLVSSGSITGTVLISTIATGTAPLTVASTTKVTNLNADLLDGQEGSYYLNRSNHTGTQLANTISNFDTEVSNNTDVAANTADRHSINYNVNLAACVVIK